MGVPIIKMLSIGLLPSPLKKAYYRLRGAKIGKGVNLGLFSIISAEKIEIGDYAKIAPLAFINARIFRMGARSKLHMQVAIDTPYVYIGEDSVIMEQTIIGGMMTPRSRINIGDRVKIFPFSFINPTEPIIIGDDVGIGGANYIFTHGSWQSELDGFPVGFGAVTIKRGTWFPWRVFVMPGVTVGEFVTIGAGSIITKDIPDYALAAGSPAKVLKTREERIKVKTEDEKHIKVKEYLKEFVELLNFKGIPSRLTEIGSDTVVIESTGKMFSKFVYQKSANVMPDAQALISLQPIPSLLKEECNKAGILIFDIATKETFFSKDKLWKEIREYFSRYGVRFKVVG